MELDHPLESRPGMVRWLSPGRLALRHSRT